MKSTVVITPYPFWDLWWLWWGMSQRGRDAWTLFLHLSLCRSTHKPVEQVLTSWLTQHTVVQ